MTQNIKCPYCKKEFPMEQGLKSHFNDLRQSVIKDAKKEGEDRIKKLEKRVAKKITLVRP